MKTESRCCAGGCCRDVPEVLVVADPQMLAPSPYAAKDGFATAAAPAACDRSDDKTRQRLFGISETEN
jgi:hypothetical protein